MIDSTKLDGFIHKYIPSHPNRKATFLLLHGTGGNEDDLVPLARMIDENMPILSPRGKVLEGGMPRYFKRLAEGVFDEKDLRFRTNELVNFLSDASEKYGFDPLSVVGVGYSNGANMAASMMLLKPESLNGAILFRAMVPLVPKKLPNLNGKKVFLSAGRVDQIIPQSQTKELQQILEEAGAKVTVNWENSGHSLVQSEIDNARMWFRK